ncbi:glial cell line-derived neurotrophic factor [Gouania willdenowi]|uniref:glial cell line-derived neurotrophic factor-like n=1 Tax=Gouania willdenowi TaxID=441366 RepID=UPI0010557971|nr:glial cell line-derived neurotrophic factor-like [Gouania willdenowi]XP_028312296.1 glial cell line-derived neurotrophic factor-like [Gouania willdenowi]
MKLWDSLTLTVCLVLLSTAMHARPLLHRRGARTAEGPPVHIRLSVTTPGIRSAQIAGGEGAPDTVEELLPNDFEDTLDFIKVTISRLRRSSSAAMLLSTTSFLTSPKERLDNRTRHRRERNKGGTVEGSRRGRGGGGVQGLDPHRRNRGGGRGQGCVLRQIHLNVSDLGLGYRSGEEMIFRYCSGPCRRSQTNYDKILYNLLYNRKLPKEDTPSQICCRPIAFDDNLSFLDDNLIYHTVKKHSARKCGCV